MPRILVPLDESELAEQALPWAGAVARALGLDVHLIGIWTYDEQIWLRAGVKDEADPRRIADAITAYLDRVAGTPSLAGLTVTTEARIGDVAEQITDAASAEDTRMVILTSHGRGGFKRLVQGSVADKLVRTLAQPILVVRPGQAHAALRRLLVTLDGSDTSEGALAPARELANGAGAEMHLLRVVNPLADVAWTGIGPGPDLSEITEQYTQAARVYLQEKALPGEVTDVYYGRPLDAILEYARVKQCDVIVMGTHGRGGITRLALGSTADAVMRAAERPVLLVPAREEPHT